MFQLLFICSLICLSSGLLNSICCRNGWISFDESCYFVGRVQKTWGEAAGFCKNFDATLMVVDSNEEWESIRPHFVRSFYSWVGLSMYPAGHGFQEPIWQVSSNYQLESLPWLSKTVGRGYSPGLNCVGYLSTPDLIPAYIHYFDCNQKFYFICERNSTFSPRLTRL